MKKKERKILNKLNSFFLTDELIEDQYEYNRYDAENTHYIVEIKHRESFYEETIIEFDKFTYNLIYAQYAKKQFIYAVQMRNKIYVFNITKLIASGYKITWVWNKMPKQTEFADNKQIKKLIGYININESIKEIYSK